MKIGGTTLVPKNPFLVAWQENQRGRDFAKKKKL
jgi:hypothetical protein